MGAPAQTPPCPSSPLTPFFSAPSPLLQGGGPLHRGFKPRGGGRPYPGDATESDRPGRRALFECVAGVRRRGGQRRRGRARRRIRWMRAKKEEGLATLTTSSWLVERVCAEESGGESGCVLLTSHSPAMHTRTETAAGLLACARGNVCMLPYLLRAVTMVHSNPTNLTVRLVMMRNKNR